MTSMQADPQSAMWEKEVESEALEDALATILDDDNKQIVKRVTKARRVVKQAVEDAKLEDGERLRCGPFVITGKARNGGGFEVPAWESVVAGSVSEL